MLNIICILLTCFLIIQQPENNPAWVSLEENIVTEFSLARDYGSIGLLAHNNLVGKEFHKLKYNDKIILNNKVYRVIAIKEYQALSPLSPYSDFKINNKILSVEELFLSIYGIPNRLILQTSIDKYNNSCWGRKFIIAVPIYRSNTRFIGKYLSY